MLLAHDFRDKITPMPSLGSSIPIPAETLLDALERRAADTPQAPVLRYFDTSISFSELNLWAEGFAVVLAGCGVGKGDRVALSLQNNPQFLIAQFAAWKRGAIVVPL